MNFNIPDFLTHLRTIFTASAYDENKFSKVISLCWQIWNGRNKSIFQKKAFSAGEVVALAAATSSRVNPDNSQQYVHSQQTLSARGRDQNSVVWRKPQEVVMLDFFMADQLCSQVPMLRNLEYVACYYITGSYKTQDYGYCMRVSNYRDLSYAVSFLPYYWRAMQCARRWFDEGETSHLLNLGKYVSAMLAAGAKVAYEKERGVGWLCLVVIMSTFATVYQLYWDFVKDWGLLQMNSKNPFLRNELMLRRKIIYYFSMGLNLVLRLAWLQTVLHSSFGHVNYRVTGLFLAALEVIRRGLWNFYRLENEHLNNAGKFRAVKTVPLPFHEVDEED